MPTIRRTPLERVMAKVEPEPNTGCWLWTGGTNNAGYGRFWLGGRLVQAHRFAYEASVGPIPDGMCVLHRCDVPPCVNPAHLFLGTNADNTSDMMTKGRGDSVPHRGERNGRAKLTAEDVRSIRARWANGETQSALAREFGVRRANVSQIVHRKKWPHI